MEAGAGTGGAGEESGAPAPPASRESELRRERLRSLLPPSGIVDPHHHLWDLELGRHPWLVDEPLIESRHGDYRPIRRRFLPADFRRAWGWIPVRATVYVEAEWDPADPLGELAWVEAVARAEGLPDAMVAQAWLDRPDIEALLEAYRAHPRVRGVRHKPAAAPRPDAVRPGAPGSMSDPAWQRGFGLLARYGLVFDLQAPWWHLGEAVRLADAHPEVPIVLDHTGLPSERTDEGLRGWRRAMGELARVPHARVKISGLGEPHLAPWSVERHRRVVMETIELFGAERCMFASNWPVETLYASWLEVMEGFLEMTGALDPGERIRLFDRTAAETYGLDPAPGQA